MTDSQAQWEFPTYTKTIHRSGYPAIDPKNSANSAVGKVVIVTGGGSGIGNGIARSFVHAGAKSVTILGRREQVLIEAKKELEKEGSSKILYFAADVVNKDQLDKAFAATEKESGKIDVVVANAGFLPEFGLAAELNVDDFWKAFEINIKGTLLTFQAFVSHKGTNTPTFISLNTAAAHAGVIPKFSGYAVSKAGQAQLIPFLQTENPDMRVVSMYPGVQESEMSKKVELPFSKDDITLPGGFAVWLASPAASWTAGKFLWSNWDVDEMLKRQDEIVSQNELVMGLQGWPKKFEDSVMVW